jgi:hypothetical protein
MKMWSKGLGRTELTMHPERCRIARDPGSENLIVYGNVADPVDWEFKITIRPEDFPGFIKMMLRYTVIKHFLKHVVRTTLSLLGIGKSNGAPDENLIENVNLAYEQIMNPATHQRPKMSRVS